MPLNGTFDVKLGQSFYDQNAMSYLTMRYDFMPASVDRTQPSSIKIDDGKEVVVTLPNVASVASGSTVYRGSARPVQKECVLIYNKRTGELTLERIAHAVQLKKTREEQKQVRAPPGEFQPNDRKASDRQSGLAPSNKRETKDPATSRRPAATVSSSAKPRTLSSSSSSSDISSCSKNSSSSGISNDGTDLPQSGQVNRNEVDEENDLSDIASDLSSPVDPSPRTSNRGSLARVRKASRLGVGGDDRHLEKYLPTYRKLIEHDLKLSDSDSNE